MLLRFSSHALAMCLVCALAPVMRADSFPVQIRVDASAPLEPLKPIWRYFGADEPNYAYMK
ncbi:MAG: hypothetical protein RLZZ245_3158, partial [Verrucomicrobiota bacterium]